MGVLSRIHRQSDVGKPEAYSRSTNGREIEFAFVVDHLQRPEVYGVDSAPLDIGPSIP